MFLATGTTGLPSNHGVNLLYSSADFESWRREHSLFNVSGGLLSCPEFYRLSNMPAGQYVYEHMADVYWIGTLDTTTVTFTPLPSSADSPLGRSVQDLPPRGSYDSGAANAGKGFNDAGDHRRIEWAWIHEELKQPFAPSPFHEPKDYRGWDGCQTVPRELTYDHITKRLKLLPAREVAGLRVREVGQFRGQLRSGEPQSVGSGRYLDISGNITRADPNSSVALRVRVGAGAYTSIAVQGDQLSVSTNQSRENCTIVDCGRRASATVAGAATAKSFRLRVLLDASVLETFVDFGVAGGSAALTSRIYLLEGLDAEGVQIVGETGSSADVSAFEMGPAVVDDIMAQKTDDLSLGLRRRRRPASPRASDLRGSAFVPGGAIIDVRREFGCKGDGRSDDTECLQAAIHAGGRQRRRVHLPGGTYVVTRSLLIYGSNQSMQPYQMTSLDMFGDGRSVTSLVAGPGQWGRASDDNVTGNLGVLEYPTCCGADPTSGSGFRLSDMVIDANLTADFGVLAPAVSESTFERLYVLQANVAGMLVAFGYDNRFLNNEFELNYIGLWVKNAANSVVISDNEMVDNVVGCYLDGTLQVLVSGNDMEGNKGPALVVFSSRALTIQANYFESNNGADHRWPGYNGFALTPEPATLRGKSASAGAPATRPNITTTADVVFTGCPGGDDGDSYVGQPDYKQVDLRGGLWPKWCYGMAFPSSAVTYCKF